MLKRSFILILSLMLLLSCNKNDPQASNTDNLPDPYKLIYGVTDIYVDGDYVMIKRSEERRVGKECRL